MTSILEAKQDNSGTISELKSLDKAEEKKITVAEDVHTVSERLIEQNREVYKVLAK